VKQESKSAPFGILRILLIAVFIWGGFRAYGKNDYLDLALFWGVAVWFIVEFKSDYLSNGRRNGNPNSDS
jgi:hypothetical protein